jgi:RNA polymerase sigma-70 factor (ECF subfamily)
MHRAVASPTTVDRAPGAPATTDVCAWAGPEALYDEYGTLAFTLAYRIVHDRGIAEDVVQEAFLSLWRNAHRYDPGRASMRTWLCRIVRNRAIDRLRGTAGRQRGDRSLDELTALCSTTDVVSDVLRHEEARTITAALAALPPSQREAIELAYYGGYSQTEIAAMTVCPLGTVKSRTRLAIRALSASLASLRPTDAVA